MLCTLVKANHAASDEDKIPDSELVAQVSYVSFFNGDLVALIATRSHRTITFAAMDTTSNAMARILSLLSQHPDVQEKIRAELRDAFRDQEELDYDNLSSLPYLDAVIKETLRV